MRTSDVGEYESRQPGNGATQASRPGIRRARRWRWSCARSRASETAAVSWHDHDHVGIGSGVGQGVGHLTPRLGMKGQQRLAGDNIVAEADMQRSEEHTSELQSLMRISYAVFCLKKKK